MRRLSLLLAVLLPALPAGAQETVPVSSLLVDPGQYDGKVVTIRGEIVGDYGDRGDVVWVQVNDDPYVERPTATEGRLAGTNTGISVRYGGDQHGDFGDPGGFGVRGPLVEITGVFRDLSPALGGLTFIEATDLTVLDRAERLDTPGVDTMPLVVGVLLALAGLTALAQRRDIIPSRGSGDRGS